MIDDSQLLGSVVAVITLYNASQEAQWRTYTPASVGDTAYSHGPTGNVSKSRWQSEWHRLVREDVHSELQGCYG